MSPPTPGSSRHQAYILLLLFIAGMGGFLYGYDIGIIGAALLYIGKTIDLTLSQESLIVAAVLYGGMVAAFFAGPLSDLIGRKKVMIYAACMFIVSVGLIVIARGFAALLFGRALQGLSCGMIAVAIPLYLAESLPANIRGRGTAIFQWLLTIGILVAMIVGTHYTKGVDALAQAGVRDGALLDGQDSAWRAMFLSAIYPAVLFLAGSLLVTESPRWLFRKGRKDQALAALKKSRPPEMAQVEFQEMADTLAREKAGQGAQTGSFFPRLGQFLRSLSKRKYILPFCLSCAVLGLTQATGVNSIVQYLVIILQQAGLKASVAAQSATFVTAINPVFTLVGFFLVDRIGRKGLLMIGTAGITAALLVAVFAFHRFESDRTDVTAAVRADFAGDNPSSRSARHLSLDAAALGAPLGTGDHQLVVVYTFGDKEGTVSASTRDPDPSLIIPPDAQGRPLVIKSAKYGPEPAHGTGTLIMVCLMVFMASFATGPGICVWLALTELMPIRIRSFGMGVGLLINQGISGSIAAFFLPLVSKYSYAAMFAVWAGSALAFFLVAAFLLPETKGKTLEEIEASFEPAR